MYARSYNSKPLIASRPKRFDKSTAGQKVNSVSAQMEKFLEISKNNKTNLVSTGLEIENFLNASKACELVGTVAQFSHSMSVLDFLDSNNTLKVVVVDRSKRGDDLLKVVLKNTSNVRVHPYIASLVQNDGE